MEIIRANNGEKPNNLDRDSGILNEQEQQVAQNLYDVAVENGGQLRYIDGENLTFVQAMRIGKRKKIIEITYSSVKEGQITVEFLKSRRGWQDNGAKGYEGFFGDTSKVEPQQFHPTAEKRDKVLNNAFSLFSK